MSSSKKRTRDKKVKVENEMIETDNSSLEEEVIKNNIEMDNLLKDCNFRVDIPLKKLKKCLTKSNNITLIYKEKYKTTTYNILSKNSNEMTGLYVLNQMNKLGFSTSYAVVFITDIKRNDNDTYEIEYERMVDTDNYERFIHH
jgi:hypothetical protein